VSTSNGALGAAAMAAIAASPPATPNAPATSRSTGIPTTCAPTRSDAIAWRPRPVRVRSRIQVATIASTTARASTKNARTWIEAPAMVMTPPRPASLNGKGSGKT